MSRIASISVATHCNDLGGKVWMPARTWTTKYAVFVVMDDTEGRRGVGECWCFDTQPDALVAFLRTEVLPHIIGLPLEEVCARAASLMRNAALSARHGMLASALSGIDIAHWDLRAKAAGVPLWQAIDPNGPGRAFLYASAGLYAKNKTEADLAAEVVTMQRQGFSMVKMKVGGLDHHGDLARVNAALAALPGDVKLIIDGVYSHTPEAALRFYHALPPARIEAFQSPVAATDYEGMARLVTAGVPVMGTEAEYRPELHAKLVEEVGLPFLQVAPVACGGLTRLIELAALVRGTNTRLSLEISSTAVALTAACHAAAALGNVAHVERHFIHQVFFGALPIRGEDGAPGWVRPADVPGLGITLAGQDVEYPLRTADRAPAGG